MSRRERVKRVAEKLKPAKKNGGILFLIQDECDKTRFYSGGINGEPRVFWTEDEIKAAEPEYDVVVRIVDTDEAHPWTIG